MEYKFQHWLLFTLAFGCLPLILRVIEASQSEGAVAYFALSDFVFLGLMFNASAMANISTEKLIPTVYRKVMILAVFTSLFLAVLYMHDVRSDLSYSTFAWICAVVLLLFAFGLSHFSSMPGEVHAVQDMLDEQDFLATFVSPVRTKLKSIRDRQEKGEAMDLEKELAELDAMMFQTSDPIRLGWDRQFAEIEQRRRLRQGDQHREKHF